MENRSPSFKVTGILFLAGALAVLVPYTLLTMIFDYPDILRQDTASVLARFHAGGTGLIGVWFAFAMAGLPLVPAFILLGQKLENRSLLVRTATTIGLIGLVVQVIGLLRWTFVVPVLARSFVQSEDTAIKTAAVVSFQTMHQFGGVLLGEHLGQLFSITWTLMMTYSFRKLQMFPGWIHILAVTASVIYLLAQAELFATVLPGFPVWEPAGFIGSTLWLIWLMTMGSRLIQLKT